MPLAAAAAAACPAAAAAACASAAAAAASAAACAAASAAAASAAAAKGAAAAALRMACLEDDGSFHPLGRFDFLVLVVFVRHRAPPADTGPCVARQVAALH